MDSYCAFSKNHTCLKWVDYQVTHHELEEADMLCHENWVEIEYLLDRVALLENTLREAGIEIP